MNTGHINGTVFGNEWQTISETEVAPLDTSLLINFDGADGATTHTAVTGQAVNFYLGAQLDTAQFKFGTASLLLDGADDYCTVARSVNWYFGKGDFTVDFWVRFNSLSGNQSFAGQFQDGNNYWVVQKDSSNYLVMAFRFDNKYEGLYYTTSPVSLSTGVWYHLCFERVGSSAKIFLNGVSQTLVEDVPFRDNDVKSLDSVLYIGNVGGQLTNGWIDEFRIVKGVAMYLSDFTPQNSAYNYPLTKLLIHGDSLGDATGKTVTATGASVSTSQYKFPSIARSISFNGSTNYLTVADSADWYFGSGDFSIDFQMYLNALPQDSYMYVVAGQYVDSTHFWRIGVWNNGGFIVLRIDVANGALQNRGYCYAGYDAGNRTGIVAGQWYHIEFGLSSNTPYFFADGVNRADSYQNWGLGERPDYAASLIIGQQNSQAQTFFNGYLSELRISKGVARHIANFTPPTQLYGGSRTVINIPSLNGDIDKEYRVILYGVNQGGSTASYIRLNGDAAANYGYQRVYGSGTGFAANRDTTSTAMAFGNANANGYCWFDEGTFYVKSGFIRVGSSKEARDINGTSVGPVILYGHSWNNTSSNVTSLALESINPNTLGPGTRMILMRRADRDASAIGKTGDINVFNVGRNTGTFQKIYETELAVSATSHQITGLNGDHDILYELIVRQISGASGSWNFLQFSGDSGANYGYQYINSTGGVLTAAASSYGGLWGSVGTSPANYFATYKYLIYARRGGGQRAAIAEGVAGLYSSLHSGSVCLISGSWNNSSSILTQIDVFGGVTNGLGAGTYIELWAYRPTI